MDEIMVVYWSQTGNTEAMAQAVAQELKKLERKQNWLKYLQYLQLT